MELQYAALSLRGTMHEENEDRALMGIRSLPPESEAVVCGQDAVSRAFAVFDGVGGHVGGAQAAEEAMNAFSEAYARNGLEAQDPQQDDDRPDAWRTKLAYALRCSNEAVRTMKERGHRAGFAAAAGVSFDDGGDVHVFHAGDVRAYRYRAPYAMRLTKDHSLAEQWRDENPGAVPPDDIRHTITRSLGHPVPPSREDDPFWPFEATQAAHALPADIYVVCSDGIWEYVEEEDLENALKSLSTPADLEDALARLARLARERGSYDDATIVAVRLP